MISSVPVRKSVIAEVIQVKSMDIVYPYDFFGAGFDVEAFFGAVFAR